MFSQIKKALFNEQSYDALVCMTSEASYEYQQGQFFELLAEQHHQDFLEQTMPQSKDDRSIHDYRNALWNFLSAALRGYSEAQYRLGLAYSQGDMGLARDLIQAEIWLLKASEQGHFAAKQALNQFYLNLDLS